MGASATCANCGRSIHASGSPDVIHCECGHQTPVLYGPQTFLGFSFCLALLALLFGGENGLLIAGGLVGLGIVVTVFRRLGKNPSARPGRPSTMRASVMLGLFGAAVVPGIAAFRFGIVDRHQLYVACGIGILAGMLIVTILDALVRKLFGKK